MFKNLATLLCGYLTGLLIWILCLTGLLIWILYEYYSIGILGGLSILGLTVMTYVSAYTLGSANAYKKALKLINQYFETENNGSD